MRPWLAASSYHLLHLRTARAGMVKLIVTCGRGRHFSGMLCLASLQRSLTTYVSTKSELNFPKRLCIRQFSDAISRDGQIQLIDENGKNAGLMEFNEAKLLAQERNLELQLTRPVSHQHPHALFKLLSKKDLFEIKKKQKVHQHNVIKNRQRVKELSLSTDIGEQDFQWKVNRIQEFLLENDKVKLIINKKRRSKKECDEFLGKVIDSIRGIGEIEGNIVKTEFRSQCLLKPISQTKKD